MCSPVGEGLAGEVRLSCGDGPGSSTPDVQRGAGEHPTTVCVCTGGRCRHHPVKDDTFTGPTPEVETDLSVPPEGPPSHTPLTTSSQGLHLFIPCYSCLDSLSPAGSNFLYVRFGTSLVSRTHSPTTLLDPVTSPATGLSSTSTPSTRTSPDESPVSCLRGVVTSVSL